MHDVKVSFNITYYFTDECDDHTLINSKVNLHQTKEGLISDGMAD